MKMPDAILSANELDLLTREDQSSFDEVAVYFSKEEWGSLSEEQKELYKNVMMENYQTLRSLGLVNAKPLVLSKIEHGEEPYVRGHQKIRTEQNPLHPTKGSAEMKLSFVPKLEQEDKPDMTVQQQVKEEEIPINICESLHDEHLEPKVIHNEGEEERDEKDIQQIKIYLDPCTSGSICKDTSSSTNTYSTVELNHKPHYGTGEGTMFYSGIKPY
ncbi:uncharacterized protein O3C94_015676 [Discoglossus pictus]